MRKHVRRRPVAGELQRRRPEQGVEIEDVLADEMNHLRACRLRCGGFGEGGEVDVRLAIAQIAKAPEIADRRVEPHVEILSGRIRDLEAEVGRIARDVPVVQAGVEPFADLVAGLGLLEKVAGVGQRRLRVAAQERLAFAELEEKVLRTAAHRYGARHHRVRMLQVRRAVGGATDLAGVAILVLRAAVRAFALDEAVGEEQFLDRIVELLHRARGDQLRVVAQAAIDVVGDGARMLVVGRAVVVEVDQEAVEVGLVFLPHPGDELLRRDAFLVGAQHDRGAVGVVGADVVDLVAPQLLEPHPDVGLDVLDQVAEVDAAVGVGQGGSDEEAAGHWSGRARGTAAGGIEVAGVGGRVDTAGDCSKACIIRRRFFKPNQKGR